jgi:hypothetical protein
MHIIFVGCGLALWHAFLRSHSLVKPSLSSETLEYYYDIAYAILTFFLGSITLTAFCTLKSY